jgi:IS30 family transposase
MKIEDQRICKFIEKELAYQKKTIKWLANEININEKTLYSKLRRKSLKAEELLEIADILSLDLNCLKRSNSLSDYDALIKLANSVKEDSIEFVSNELNLDEFINEEFKTKFTDEQILEGMIEAKAFLEIKYHNND